MTGLLQALEQRLTEASDVETIRSVASDALGFLRIMYRSAHNVPLARAESHGDGTSTVLMLRPDGTVRCATRVDDIDVPFVMSQGWKERKGYLVRRNGGQVALSRLLLKPTEGLQVDHINGDRTDNRRSNLRVVTVHENRQNTPGRGVLGLRNVDIHKGRYRVRVTAYGVRHECGVYDTAEEAETAAIAARARLLTHHNEARTNASHEGGYPP